MEFSEAIRQLPGAYAAAIVLQREGLDHARIGQRLGIDEMSVGTLLEIGRAKLAALEADAADGREQIR
jgi:DNA-directed RNA polymerase specialized sigma24 family protein